MAVEPKQMGGLFIIRKAGSRKDSESVGNEIRSYMENRKVVF